MTEFLPCFDLGRQTQAILADGLKSIEQCANRGDFILGEQVSSFEHEFAEFIGVKHCVGVASGTDALTLALMSLGLQSGDEVIVPSFGFPATAEAVLLSGATPVFVDVLPGTLTIDPTEAQSSIGPRTVALIAVHLYGHPARMDDLLALCMQSGIALVEDAAQAHGSRYGQAFLGGMGHLGCFSFYPTKTIGAWGDAGAVCTNDAELAEKVRNLRHHGQASKHEHLTLGMNSRLDNIQAAILILKLRRFTEDAAARSSAAATYDDMLLGLDAIRMPVIEDRAEPVWHLYVIQAKSRQGVFARFSEHGIEQASHYPYAITSLPPFTTFASRRFPVAELAATQVTSLPFFPGITKEQQFRVKQALMASAD